jgi:hypothetical protein
MDRIVDLKLKAYSASRHLKFHTQETVETNGIFVKSLLGKKLMK